MFEELYMTASRYGVFWVILGMLLIVIATIFAGYVAYYKPYETTNKNMVKERTKWLRAIFYILVVALALIFVGFLLREKYMTSFYKYFEPEYRGEYVL